jgi:hypothetical protein
MSSRARSLREALKEGLKEGLAKTARVAGWLYSPIPVALGDVLKPNFPITDRGLERKPSGAAWAVVVSELRAGAARAIAGMRELAEREERPRSTATDLRLLVGRVSDPRAAAHLPRLGAILATEVFSGLLSDLKEVERGEPPPTAGSFSSAFEGRTPEGERVGVVLTYRVAPAPDGKYELYIDTLRLIWGGVPRVATRPSWGSPSGWGYGRPLGSLWEGARGAWEGAGGGSPLGGGRRLLPDGGGRAPAPRGGDPRALARELLADLDLLYEDVRLGRLEEWQVADALRSVAERGRELLEAAAALALAGRLTPYAAERLMEGVRAASEALGRLEGLAWGGAGARRLADAVADAKRAVARLLDRLPAAVSAAQQEARREEPPLARPAPTGAQAGGRQTGERLVLIHRPQPPAAQPTAKREEGRPLLVRPAPPPAAGGGRGSGAPAAQPAREPPVVVEEYVVSPERGTAERLEEILRGLEELDGRVLRGERPEEVARAARLLAERLEGLLGKLDERTGKPVKRALESLRLLAERGSQLVYTQILSLLAEARSWLRDALWELARSPAAPSGGSSRRA